MLLEQERPFESLPQELFVQLFPLEHCDASTQLLKH